MNGWAWWLIAFGGWFALILSVLRFLRFSSADDDDEENQ